MKKMQAVIISLLFLISSTTQAALFEAPNPYKFGPQGRAVSDLRDFATPKQMVSILPNRPVVATDSEGNRVYYTPDGKMALSIAKNGAMSFSLGGVTKSKNSSGELTGITRTIQGSGLRQEIRNENDQIIGYKELNGKGKTVATYDKDNNLTSTYHYKGQGAKLDYVQNEMTLGRTYYDDYNRAIYEINFEGYVLATYQYQDVSYEYGSDGKSVVAERTSLPAGEKNRGLLISKKNYEAEFEKFNEEEGTSEHSIGYKTTFYNLEGRETHVTNNNGQIIQEFHYKNDGAGNEILDYIEDNLTHNKTYFDEHGKKDYTVNDQNTVLTRYFDDYIVNYSRDGNYAEVTMLDIDGTELYTTLKNIEYNDDGTINKVLDGDDRVLEEYFYKYDSEGNKVIDYVVNYSDDEFDGKTTYLWYNDNKPQYVTSTPERPTDDTDPTILKDFSWNGNTLVYTFNRQTENTKWYQSEKDWVYETFNERIISKNVYNNGQKVGVWNAQKHELTILINERNWITIAGVDEEPTAAFIMNIIEKKAIVERAADMTHDEVIDLNKILSQH
ncbi:MAG: hypothetical protein II816_06035 [Elusimicrobia bacterium]|nr:hypothetical protein [Elusimicrobiota bacterium]